MPYKTVCDKLYADNPVLGSGGIQLFDYYKKVKLLVTLLQQH